MHDFSWFLHWKNEDSCCILSGRILLISFDFSCFPEYTVYRKTYFATTASAEIFEMLKKVNLSDQAYEELVKKIVSGVYPAGETLPEEKLTAEFGISRTPVREALRRLAAEGLIEPLPRGFRVTMLDDKALRELFECRCGLELQALENAITRIPEEKLEELLSLLGKCSAGRNAAKNALAADQEMHALIRNYCGNRYLAQLISQFHLKTAPYRNYRNYESSRLEELVAERSGILSAIRERDLERAGKLLAEHILKGCFCKNAGKKDRRGQDCAV